MAPQRSLGHHDMNDEANTAADYMKSDELSHKLQILSMDNLTPMDSRALSPATASKSELLQRQLISAPDTVFASETTPPRHYPSSSRDRPVGSASLKDKRSVSAAFARAPLKSPKAKPRRSSSNVPSSPCYATECRPEATTEVMEELSPSTASSIACAHFQQELQQHHQVDSMCSSKTVVIVHDSCYGHRYSRPRTTKANLSTIVERPERIHASLLGVAAAYVRLGRKYGEEIRLKKPTSKPMVPASIPFRIQKSARSVDLNSPAITSVHGVRWMEELKRMCELAESNLALNGKELSRPEIMGKSNEVEARAELHEGDLYLCSGSLDALQGAIGGVCDGVDAIFGDSAKETGARRAFVCIRPPGHHCSSAYPSGFCWLNNVHIGIAHASMMYGLTHAAIIDFDLHHGDGSQAIAWEHNARVSRLPRNASNSKKTAIGYFSLHDINSYPCEMGDEDKLRNASVCLENAHGQTIWNVHLELWKDEREFWYLYETKYSILIDKARKFLSFHTDRLKSSTNQPSPKAAIFISAGFDASQWEGPGMQRHKVNVPTSFYARITRDIVTLSEDVKTAAGGRVISILEGGYSDRALTSGVLSHLSGLAADEGPQASDVGSELCYDMWKRTGSDVAEPKATEQALAADLKPEWWSVSRLEELEALVNPIAAIALPKNPRKATRPTYTSTTQSFNAKIVPGSTIYRDTSTRSPKSSNLCSPSTPPSLPDIRWSTSAYELSKLLIPTNRQTSSCKHEDLSAPATRARRERYSIDLPSELAAKEGTRMQLRERKIKPSNQTLEETDEPAQPNRIGSKSRRRTTLGGAAPQGHKTVAEAANTTNRTPMPLNRALQRNPRILSNFAKTDVDIPPLPSATFEASQMVNETSTADTHLPDSSASLPPASRDSKPTTAGSFKNVRGTHGDVVKAAPSKRTVPARKAPPKQFEPLSKAPRSNPSGKTAQGMGQIASAGKLNKTALDELASDMTDMSIGFTTPRHRSGVRDAINAVGEMADNQRFPADYGQQEKDYFISDTESSRLIGPQSPILGCDLGRGGSAFVGPTVSLLPDQSKYTGSPPSDSAPAVAAKSGLSSDTWTQVDERDHRTSTQTRQVQGIDDGVISPELGPGFRWSHAESLTRSTQTGFSDHTRELPVFTPDSPIPFAKVNVDGLDSKAERLMSEMPIRSPLEIFGTSSDSLKGATDDRSSIETQDMSDNAQRVRNI